MTPFGEKLRAIRAARGLALKDMAAGLQVSPAYLSAMEHGRRGKPSRRFVHRVCQFLGIIWDEAEELQHLADLSHPQIGRAHVRTPVTNAHLVCRLLLEKKQ